MQCLTPGEGLATVGADVGLLHAALMGAHVVAHAILPFEALLADGAGEGLLIRVGQAVAVEVVDIPEGLAARLARVVLPHRVGVGIGGPLCVQTIKTGQLRRLFSHADTRHSVSCTLQTVCRY